jgi:ABC-type Fe3+/spermidine/putrescine transport system ATPase subunit
VRTGDLGGAGAGERVHAVVRPEKLGLQRSDAASAADSTSVEGQVESSLYMGTATQMIVRLGDGTGMTVLIPNDDLEARRALPAPGEPARLTWSPENIHVVTEPSG